MLFVSVLALSVSHSFDSSPKGGALGKTGNFAVLPKPLTLGEVARRKP